MVLDPREVKSGGAPEEGAARQTTLEKRWPAPSKAKAVCSGLIGRYLQSLRG